MKVSIITVTYNSEKYIADCIASVRKQTYGNIEHIIVDGKSTDNTLKIIQKNSNSITHWISETDRGMYDAINKGIKMASGDIMGVLNSDDMLASADVIMDIVACFDEKKIDSVYGDLVYVDPANPQKVMRYWKGLSYKRSRFTYGWMPAHPTFYIRRELIDRFGGYENHYYTAADYEFMARYLYRHKISSCYLSKMIVKMRNGGVSNSSIYRRLRANRRDYLAMKINKIPLAFLVSILKPLIKIPQYKSSLGHKVGNPNKPHKFFSTTVLFFPADAKAEAEIQR
ncbi:MAG TPA: glycosyltransferase family 2 protein [Ginsengibacter sp.]|nr:glycosyltransferase family 2 protein [Ginsengibacter sp.]